MKSSSSGFTLIEMMAVVVIIGMVMATALPRIRRPKQATGWKHLVRSFNKLAHLCQQHANKSGDRCRLSLTRNKEGGGMLAAQREELFVDEKVASKYHPIDGGFIASTYEIPSEIEVHDCFVPSKSTDKKAFNCYFMPYGLADSMMVRLIRDDEYGVSKYTFAMSPFIGLFKMQNGFTPFPHEKTKG